ncbi:MAG TPA: hypothetical protein VF517_17400 [Thermoleophilaceae bacterium]|jgi:hypothetical protein
MAGLRGVAIASGAAALVLAAGCGGGGAKKQEKPATPAETPVNDPPVQAKESGAPSDLLGQYTVKLPKADLPKDAPEELTEGSETWTVTLAETGGPGEGPAFTIANDQLGALESSNFEVKGDRILLHEEECAQTGEPVESEWTYELKGERLTLKEAKGACPDEVASTILTTSPLQRKK